MKSCWACKHCINDYFNTGTLDCTRMDDMTEDEFENYYGNNGGENCPYYKPYMTDAEIEAENKMIEKMLDKLESKPYNSIVRFEDLRIEKLLDLLWD